MHFFNRQYEKFVLSSKKTGMQPSIPSNICKLRLHIHRWRFTWCFTCSLVSSIMLRFSSPLFHNSGVHNICIPLCSMLNSKISKMLDNRHYWLFAWRYHADSGQWRGAKFSSGRVQTASGIHPISSEMSI